MTKHAWIVLVVASLGASCRSGTGGGKQGGNEAPLAVESARWIDRAEAHPTTIAWDDTRDERGLAVIVRRADVTGTLMVHSTDFALAFESESDIPRRPCIGISAGMDSPQAQIRWGTLGGSVSRYWIKPDERYFAVLFSAPKKVKSFGLHRAVALGPSFEPMAPTPTPR